MATPRAKKTTFTMRTQPVLPIRKYSDKSFRCNGMLLSDILIKIKAAGGDPDGAKITKDQFPCYNDGVTGVNCTYGVPESNDSYNKQLIIYQQKLAKYRLWVQTELPGLLIAQQASTAKELEALELAASEARARLNNC